MKEFVQHTLMLVVCMILMLVLQEIVGFESAVLGGIAIIWARTKANP